ncbi:MAG: hypothetical protein Kow0049_33410 [Stanieria sp.]
MDTVYLASVHRCLLELSGSKKMPSKHDSLSVTDVRVAFECPRLFYLSKRFGGKTLFIPKDKSFAIGSTFHKLAEEFITQAKLEPQFKSLFKPSVEKLDQNAIAVEVQNLFYSLVFFPHYLQPTIDKKPNSGQALTQIWQGLKNLIQQWTELLIKNRAYCDVNNLFDRTFVSKEFKLEHNFNLPNGSQQLLLGKLDSLIYDCKQDRFCVVELKTYHPVDPSAQLAQVALYSYMIEQITKLPVDSAVYCVLPEFKEYHYSWEELESNVHEIIPLKLQQMQQWLRWEPPQPDVPPPTSNSDLCNICPQQEKCQSFFCRCQGNSCKK